MTSTEQRQHDDWQNVLDVNLSGAFYLSQAAMQDMLCFLAADESAYITGQIRAVNGGLDM
jgi:NAD(P)-dependent dehydrogenase (short-subunit alcohol dehydrogenase family)